MKPQDIKQKSDEWYLIRKARFTASEILSICDSKQSFETAVFEKVHEAMMPDDVFLNIKYNERSSASMDWGNLYEDEAAKYFSKITGKEVSEIGFIEYGDHAGGSPDRLILEDNSQLEIKCPYNGLHHLKFSKMKSQKELLEYCKYGAAGKKYYYQMQANMLFDKADYCMFLSYDPRLIEMFRGKPLLIEPDKEIQEIIEESINKASKMKLEILNELVMDARKVG